MKVLDAKIIDLSFGDVAIAYLLVAVVMVILHGQKLESIGDFYWAAGRMALQLFAVGFVLAILFRLNEPHWIMLAVTAMWLIASWIAVRPLRERKRQFFAHAMGRVETARPRGPSKGPERSHCCRRRVG